MDVVDEMLAQQAASMRQFEKEMARVERGMLDQMLGMEQRVAPRVHMHDDIATGQRWRVYEREGGWRGTGEGWCDAAGCGRWGGPGCGEPAPDSGRARASSSLCSCLSHATGSLRYYSERYAVSQPTRHSLVPSVPSVQSRSVASPLLVTAAFLAGLWAVLSALLVRNYDRTAYAPESRLTLVVLWPLLLLTSAPFRGQFARAVGWAHADSPPSSMEEGAVREDKT